MALEITSIYYLPQLKHTRGMGISITTCYHCHGLTVPLAGTDEQPLSKIRNARPDELTCKDCGHEFCITCRVYCRDCNARVCKQHALTVAHAGHQLYQEKDHLGNAQLWDPATEPARPRSSGSTDDDGESSE